MGLTGQLFILSDTIYRQAIKAIVAGTELPIYTERDISRYSIAKYTVNTLHILIYIGPLAVHLMRHKDASGHNVPASIIGPLPTFLIRLQLTILQGDGNVYHIQTN